MAFYEGVSKRIYLKPRDRLGLANNMLNDIYTVDTPCPWL
jgi:hypothetical protein